MGEFSHGFSRGFWDDTTWGGSSYLCGNYNSPSTLGSWGYHCGTGASMAAALLYGGAEVRVLKGAATGLYFGANKVRQSWIACNQATTAAKALHETHQVAKLASDAASIEKISQITIKNNIAGKEAFQLNRFHYAARELSETGQNNIRILRGWAKSKGWEKFPNNGGPEKWGLYDKMNGNDWFLRIKPESSYREGLNKGSHIPRFDARFQHGSQGGVNPFTGKTGGKDVGSHIPLEYEFF